MTTQSLKAFNEGKICYENGGSITNNPYAFTHENHTAWARGFSITERNAEEDVEEIKADSEDLFELTYDESLFPERGAPVSMFEVLVMEPLLDEVDIYTIIDLQENEDYFID